MKAEYKRIIALYEIFNRDSEKFLKIFKQEGKEIIHLLNNKIKVSNSENNQINKAYHYIIERETKDFQQYKKKLIYEKKINEKKLIIEEHYHQLITTYTLLKKNLEEKISGKNVLLNNGFIEINKKLDKINKSIIIDLNSEINNYLLTFNTLKNFLSEILVILSNQVQIVVSNNIFKLEIENFSTLKKLNIKDLEIGDIILYQFNKRDINVKSVHCVINSTILYSSIVYENTKECLVYQNSNKDILTSGISPFNLRENVHYIVMRPKKKLTSIDKENIQNLLKLSINTEYSLLKLYGVALHYTLIRIYKTIFSFIGNKEGKILARGIFSSQIIARVYEALEIKLTQTEHFGIVTPSEILNSKELKVLGCIKKY